MSKIEPDLPSGYSASLVSLTNLTPPDAMPLWHQDKDMLTWLTNLGR